MQKHRSQHDTPMQAQSAGEGIARIHLQPGSTRRWVDSTALRHLYPQERPGNYCTVLHYAAITSSPAFLSLPNTHLHS